jgi:hypothetical protein
VRKLVSLILVVLLVSLPLASQQPQEPVDLDAIYKIKQEGLGVRTSRVMEIMSYLTDVHGPRLTGSPTILAAAEWAKSKLTEWGLVNVKLEPWGPFGRGWTNDRFYMQVTSPVPFPVIGYPLAWTPGTDGLVSGEAVVAVIEREEDFEKFRGKLKGKFVLTQNLRAVEAHFRPDGERYTDEQLANLARQPVPTVPVAPQQPQAFPGGPAGPAGQQLVQRRNRFFVDEGVAALLSYSRVGDGGTVFVGGGGSRQADAPPNVPRVVIAVEHYGRIFRTLQKNLPVALEANIQNTFHSKDLNSFNVIGEIPGTDKADELVMVGAHFDSWHSGTGATDNGAGSAVMMEAMRILKATGLKMRRTVRMGLWTGEEQGLLGSRAYVTEHFADRATMKLKPEHGKFSVYFNVDNGTGKIRGVYLQGNEAAAPVFEAWMKPFANMGMTTLTTRNTGGTDHLSFDAVGLPGFQFIQDEIEYDARTHHSNMDVYERIQEEDMKQMAVIVASLVYHAANRAQLFPRKPLPPPQPQQGPPGGGPPPPPQPPM